jgi:hypothetical protein
VLRAPQHLDGPQERRRVDAPFQMLERGDHVVDALGEDVHGVRTSSARSSAASSCSAIRSTASAIP